MNLLFHVRVVADTLTESFGSALDSELTGKERGFVSVLFFAFPCPYLELISFELGKIAWGTDVRRCPRNSSMEFRRKRGIECLDLLRCIPNIHSIYSNSD
jgi:hypothetical protein